MHTEVCNIFNNLCILCVDWKSNPGPHWPTPTTRFVHVSKAPKWTANSGSHRVSSSWYIPEGRCRLQGLCTSTSIASTLPEIEPWLHTGELGVQLQVRKHPSLQWSSWQSASPLSSPIHNHPSKPPPPSQEPGVVWSYLPDLAALSASQSESYHSARVHREVWSLQMQMCPLRYQK